MAHFFTLPDAILRFLERDRRTVRHDYRMLDGDPRNLDFFPSESASVERPSSAPLRASSVQDAISSLLADIDKLRAHTLELAERCRALEQGSPLPERRSQIERIQSQIERILARILRTPSLRPIAAGALGVVVIIGLVALWPGGNADEAGTTRQVAESPQQPVPQAPAQEPPTVTAQAPPKPPAAAQTDKVLPQEAVRPAPAVTITGLAAYTGRLAIISEPRDSMVLIDRRAVGRTPLTVVPVRPGTRLVWVVSPGYRPWTAVVKVPADTVTNVNATLQSRQPARR